MKYSKVNEVLKTALLAILILELPRVASNDRVLGDIVELTGSKMNAPGTLEEYFGVPREPAWLRPLPELSWAAVTSPQTVPSSRRQWAVVVAGKVGARARVNRLILEMIFMGDDLRLRKKGMDYSISRTR